MADFEALPAGSRRAMELALEALEFMADQWGFTNKANRPERWQAIQALRAALAEPEEQHQPGCALLKIPSSVLTSPADERQNQEPSITAKDERSCLTCAHMLKSMLEEPCVNCMGFSQWKQSASVTGAVLRWFGWHRATRSE